MQPAESNLKEFSMHTRNIPLSVCHLLDDGSVASAKHQHWYTLLAPTTNHHIVCFVLSSSALSCTRGRVNVGRLHRLVSKEEALMRVPMDSVCAFDQVLSMGGQRTCLERLKR